MIMSLMRLLTAGKSWVGFEHTPSRYQMSDPRAMPKFGSVKNPFRKTTTPEGKGNDNSALTQTSPSGRGKRAEAIVRADSSNAVAPVTAAARASNSDESRAGSEQRTANSEVLRGQLKEQASGRVASAVAETSNIEHRTPNIEVPNHQSQAGTHPRTGWFGALVEKAGSLLLRPGVKPLKSGPSQIPKGPVQGELSLERIKVIRNDLSDTDLEIVPVKAPAARPSAEPAMQMAVKPISGETDRDLAIRFFDAAKS
jgi:hypothetical protein